MSAESAPDSLFPESWSVKEVVADLKQDLVGHLDKQDAVLHEISAKVDSKADKTDVVLLGAKIDGHAERITTLEQHRAETLAATQFRHRVWAVIGTVGGILAILAGSLIAAFVH